MQYFKYIFTGLLICPLAGCTSPNARQQGAQLQQQLTDASQSVRDSRGHVASARQRLASKDDAGADDELKSSLADHDKALMSLSAASTGAATLSNTAIKTETKYQAVENSLPMRLWHGFWIGLILLVIGVALFAVAEAAGGNWAVLLTWAGHLFTGFLSLIPTIGGWLHEVAAWIIGKFTKSMPAIPAAPSKAGV